MIKKEMGSRKKQNNLNNVIESIHEYKDSTKFTYNGNNFEGGLL